jgi:pimeloyl-ACP methyl ester carboxylesterase
MLSWQAGDVVVRGVRLHYARTGGSKPPLVLAHGITDDGACWSAVAEELAADYDVIAVDARGHGFSEAPETGYDMTTLAEDLYGVIIALELRKPTLLGHSMGAITTLALTGLYPDVPRAILLEDPPPWWLPSSGPEHLDNQRRAELRAWLLGLKDQTRDALIRRQRAVTPTWSQTELDPWADSKLRVNPNAVRLYDPGVSSSIQWAECLPRITCPVLLITADPSHGAIVTPEAAEALQRYIPHLRVAAIQEAGHSIHREQLRAFMEVVCAYLAQPS